MTSNHNIITDIVSLYQNCVYKRHHTSSFYIQVVCHVHLAEDFALPLQISIGYRGKRGSDYILLIYKIALPLPIRLMRSN